MSKICVELVDFSTAKSIRHHHHLNYISFSTILFGASCATLSTSGNNSAMSSDENTMDRTTAADALDDVDSLSRELPMRPRYVIAGTTWTLVLTFSSFSRLSSQIVTTTVGPEKTSFMSTNTMPARSLSQGLSRLERSKPAQQLIRESDQASRR